jgi:hypothetical protein
VGHIWSLRLETTSLVLGREHHEKCVKAMNSHQVTGKTSSHAGISHYPEVCYNRAVQIITTRLDIYAEARQPDTGQSLPAV